MHAKPMDCMIFKIANLGILAIFYLFDILAIFLCTGWCGISSTVFNQTHTRLCHCNGIEIC